MELQEWSEKCDDPNVLGQWIAKLLLSSSDIA
jgi:hypothetical protein